MAHRTLPSEYVARIVELHYQCRLTYQQIKAELIERFPWCTLPSIKKALQRWRKDNLVMSYQEVAKDINERLIAHYESAGCKMRVADLVTWANEYCRRADDNDWNQQRVSSVLCDWRIRTGRMSQRQLRQMGTWDRIHELMSTGHTASMVAEIFNAECYQLANDQPWTAGAVNQFHCKYSKRYNVDLASTAYRSEQECLEVAFLASMWRVDGYDAPQIVDRLNESKLYFYHGRPWTRCMVNNVIYRARSILREVEGVRSMSAVVDDRDTRVITASAMAAMPESSPQLRVVDASDEDMDAENVQAEKRSEKLQRMSQAAFRIAELRDEGARVADIRADLDQKFPRPGGWANEQVDAVERWGRAEVQYERRRRDPERMDALAERVHRLRGAYSHAQIAAVLNSDQVDNVILPGNEWLDRHVQAVLDWRKNRAKKGKSRKSTDGPNQLENVIGRRKMRAADVAIREHARSVAAMKEAAFTRAKEIHAQIELLQRELALAEHVVDQSHEAEALLIETGPRPLVERLNELRKCVPIRGKDTDVHEATIAERAKEVEEITHRICSEDWR